MRKRKRHSHHTKIGIQVLNYLSACYIIFIFRSIKNISYVFKIRRRPTKHLYASIFNRKSPNAGIDINRSRSVESPFYIHIFAASNFNEIVI